MSVIDDLSALQDHDGIIRDLEKQVKDIPVRREQELGRLSTEQEELDKAKNQVSRLKIEAMNDEVRISEIKETVRKFKTQQITLKTNQEFAAMNSQIAKEEDSLKAAESKLIDAQLSMEPAEKEVRECEARFNEAKKEVDVYVDELDKLFAEFKGKLDQALAERVEKLKPLDVPSTKKFLMYYERLRKNRWPVLIKLSENVCSGCHMELPPSKHQEARKNTLLANEPARMTIVACDFCGRIVY